MENLEHYFVDEQADFYAYMVEQSLFSSRKTYHDYISRLRFVSRYYRLDKTLTQSDVDAILEDLRQTVNDREGYNTIQGVNDIGSGLKRFLQYVQSDFRRKMDDTILAEEKKILKDSSMTCLSTLVS